jgi:site-specific recombinase XerD
MSNHLDGWAAWMRTASVRPKTIGLRTYHVTRAARELPVSLDHATVDDLSAWLSAQEWLPATRRSYRSSLVGYYRFLQRLGVRPDNPGQLLPAVRVPRGLPRPVPDPILLDALASAGPRIRMAMLLAGECGLRRGEIAALHTDHIETDLIGLTLRVIGKGGHVRMVPVPKDTDGFGLQFLLRRLPAGWVFPSPAGGHLTPEHLGRIVSRALPDGWTCHTLRHRFGTTVYRNTRDLRVAQELLGHARPETTAIYTQVAVNDLRAAVQTSILRVVRDEEA